MTLIAHSAAELADRVVDGLTIGLAPDYSGCAMSVVYELIRQQRRGLSLVGVPQLGLQGDLLIGAKCVSVVDAAAVTLGEFGQAPRFVEAATDGSIRMQDSTCPVIHAGLQAAEKGIPFMPLRGVLGSDLLKHRPDWQVVDNPFNEQVADDPILLVPAIAPDVSVFHAPLADRDGNVWVGVRRELMLMAHASRSTLVSVEKISDTSLLEDPHTAAGVIPSLYVSAIAEVPGGAAPVGLFGCYEPDSAWLKSYVSAAKTQAGFTAFMDELLRV